MERFGLRKLNEAEGKENYQTEISNRFEVLKNVEYNVDMNRDLETIIENTKISAKKVYVFMNLETHKPLVGEECSKLLDQRKHAGLQWLQDPSQIHWDNLNNIRREASRNFRNKKRKYLKVKINDLATNSKNNKISKN
jgi:hypothetical protein